MDSSLLIAINSLRAPWLDPWMSFLSEWGIYLYLLAMLGWLALKWRHARSVRDGWLAWFVGLYVTEMIVKPIVARPRPTADPALLEQLHVLGRVPPPTSLAFPSGTASAAFAGAVWIALRFGWKPGVPALLLAALIGFSRVYAAVHWPSDILAGALIGAGVAYGWHRLSLKLDARAPHVTAPPMDASPMDARHMDAR
ncbi:MAG: phosphatase PAP2 family protein [Sandaracinaceae bacterium]